MCGIVGIVSSDDVNQQIYDSLLLLQHRGQDSTGIATMENTIFHIHKAKGQVNTAYRTRDMRNLIGKIGLGHVRYATKGSAESVEEAQPFYVNAPYGIVLIHNGNLTNTRDLEKQLFNVDKRHTNSSSDTEMLLNVLATELQEQIHNQELEPDIIFDAVKSLHKRIQGSYASIALISGHGLLAFRDPFGIRPLVIGKLKSSYVLASETCALDIIGAKYIRDVENGEIICIENGKLESIKPFPQKKIRPCVFEYIYFSRPDSILGGKTAYEYRKNFGAELAKEERIEADLVVPVPDSGNAAALGYSQQKKMSFDLGLIRNHYVGRTFIEPSQKIRSLGVKLKLNANHSVIKNKKIILVDDSLVRGTTSSKIVKMLYDAGAKEVHLRIASPEIKFPDFYGVDMPTKKELLAANKSVEEIRDIISAKSLRFLSIDGLYKAMGFENRNNNYPQLTDHYFTGDYPVKIIDELGEDKVTQLSLLSTGSNN